MQTIRVLFTLALFVAVLNAVTPDTLAYHGPVNGNQLPSATLQPIGPLDQGDDLTDSAPAFASTTGPEDSGEEPPVTEFLAGESPILLTDSGIGFNLTLPAWSSALYPTDLQAISVVQIHNAQPADQASVMPVKIEIAAEHVMDSVTEDQWRQMREYFAASFGERTVKSSAVVVAGLSGTFREISTADGAVFWETELWVGHTAYIIAGTYSPDMIGLYEEVLNGLSFTGSEQLPVNDLTPIDVLTQAKSTISGGVEAPEAQPNLKFPFNGTRRITCAYYADNPKCHSLTKIALDFGLSYEAVRAAHSGSLSRPPYHANYGNWIRLSDSSDPSYVTVYAHLQSFMGSTGRVNQGDYIARSGSTGNSDGAHLHFELQKSGVRIKPEPMCGQTRFLKDQTKTDCWPATEAFGSGATSQISITTQSVNLRVCAPNLPGRTVYVSMWRDAAAGYPARGWLASQVASSTCVQFNDLDGAGNTFAGVPYYTNAALRAIPSNLASQKKSGCYSTTGGKLLCDIVRR